jgi:hypothetical protein
MKRDWCGIHGAERHLHVWVCGRCGTRLNGWGERTCQDACVGAWRKNWLPDGAAQVSWRCIEG